MSTRTAVVLCALLADFVENQKRTLVSFLEQAEQGRSVSGVWTVTFVSSLGNKKGMETDFLFRDLVDNDACCSAIAAIKVRMKLCPQFPKNVVLSLSRIMENWEGLAVCSVLCTVGRCLRKSEAKAGFRF